MTRAQAPKRSATVVGAGIAGLAAAHTLTKLDYEVTVFERSPELRTEGAGISLWPNATAALHALDLGDVTARRSHVIDAVSLITPKGGTLSHLSLRDIAARYGPLVAIHRTDLLGELFEYAQAVSTIEFDSEVTIVDGELYIGQSRIDCDLIVGADGVHSIVRHLVAPDAQPRSAGYGAWRGVANDVAVASGLASEAIGRGKRIGLVPIGNERIYWFAVLAGGDGSEDLDEAFAGWHHPIQQVLAQTPNADRSYLELYDLRPLPAWHREDVVLVGDAAHAMTPNLGQGAAQALQDVAVLGRELRAAEPAKAFRLYERARKKHAESVVRQSRRIGRFVQAAHPVSARLRDFLIRHTPDAITEWNLRQILGQDTGQVEL